MELAYLSLFVYLFIYLFSWLCWVLVATRGIVAMCRIFVVVCGIFSYGMWALSCGMWDLVPSPGIEPRPPALGPWSLIHWTVREVPSLVLETENGSSWFWV